VLSTLNVDGFDATPTGSPWRQNVDPFMCSPCPAFYANNRGYDINRYHSYLTGDPDDDPNTGPVNGDGPDNPVPEAKNVRAAYDAAGGADKVDVVLDLHHQGTYADPDGSMVTGATFWPNATETAAQLGIADQFEDVITRSTQTVSTLLAALESKGYANFSRYPGTLPPGISRNAYGLLGSASVLMAGPPVAQPASTIASIVSAPRARATDTRWWPSRRTYSSPTATTEIGGSVAPRSSASQTRSQR
jgi:hypothetical protein